MAVPCIVSATPLPDAGTSVGSSPEESARPTTLASPQSTTSVSPNLPSMMLPGLRSRCSTPRLCGVGHGIADIDEPTQQLAKLQAVEAGTRLMEPVAGVLEVVALDEPHGIERPTIGIGAQAIHGHDAWMLQAARDFGFQHEPTATGVPVGMLPLDLLECHLAVQFQVLGDKHFAQAAFGMRTQHAVADRVRRPVATGWGYVLREP